MKTLADYETELGDLEKCIRFEMNRDALKEGIYRYVECQLNIWIVEMRLMIAQLN